MKKILIYKDGSALKPTGGPSGYLYSLRDGIRNLNNTDITIDFLPGEAVDSSIKSIAKTSSKPLVKHLLSFYRIIKHIKFCLSTIYIKKSLPLDVNDYDAIHFHSTCDIYWLREELKEYKGKILLTSHSPQPLSAEFYEGSSSLEKLFLGKIYKKMVEFDRYAFRRADYIIFPCSYADEPYLNTWDEYIQIKDDRKEHFRFVLSGTVPAKVAEPRCEVRKKLNIPEDAFVISYVGRHNEIKGYDRFIEICTKLQEENKNIYVLVAGNVGPIYPPENNKHWIEIGWTNTPHSYVAASDLFILPNRETYFDLVLLEVLSIGIPVVISRTGGNKYFDNISSEGIKLFDNVDEAIGAVNDIIGMDVEQREKVGTCNKNLYQNKFTIEKFAKNYINLLKHIL